MADVTTEPAQTSEPVAEPVTEPAQTPVADDHSLIGGAQSQTEPDAQAEPDAKDTKPAAPESYELEMPEGYELDTETLEAVTPMLKEMGATTEQAQALADIMVKKMTAQRNAECDAFSETVKSWKEETLNDPEIGGRNLDKNLSSVAKVIDKYAEDGAAVRQMLDDSGLGNHPAFVKMMVRVAQSLDTDKWVDSPGNNKGNIGEDEFIKGLFPNSLK